MKNLGFDFGINERGRLSYLTPHGKSTGKIVKNKCLEFYYRYFKKFVPNSEGYVEIKDDVVTINYDEVVELAEDGDEIIEPHTEIFKL